MIRIRASVIAIIVALNIASIAWATPSGYVSRAMDRVPSELFPDELDTRVYPNGLDIRDLLGTSPGIVTAARQLPDKELVTEVLEEVQPESEEGAYEEMDNERDQNADKQNSHGGGETGGFPGPPSCGFRHPLRDEGATRTSRASVMGHRERARHQRAYLHQGLNIIRETTTGTTQGDELMNTSPAKRDNLGDGNGQQSSKKSSTGAGTLFRRKGGGKGGGKGGSKTGGGGKNRGGNGTDDSSDSS
ncbi:hypothetical protein AMATHDRAFT_7739 [Amanita thiersii Skay4041]|uniref:Secreted protein n=1 Tax=Amanita thiersii Skay4041 TaxID=703135 RepID=A0A2A9NFT2_9AGAR|nr:hypothetical protein AMATHDRAFT_7739 [Amanita thiersii Skay4041]